MGLSPGTNLGPYEVIAQLGAGGMGEVYRARDTQLGRDVALKVLPEILARDPERMARFKREAQVLASLNHPNIATIHGFEESDGLRSLVMELVEGSTLGELLEKSKFENRNSGATGSVIPAQAGIHSASGVDPRLRGGDATHRAALQPDDALPIAKQIADGLEYAHDRGIIHRDLKPANIKITPEGTVKILDFGLAKALDVGAGLAPPSGAPQAAPLQDSPTLTAAATQAGVILGTAAYMSPEQARGKPVDRRADIWAFGCVLYEMLSGAKPFVGETVTDVLASVVKTEPAWEALPADTPPRILEVIRRCLTKDPKQRLRDIGDARIAVEETMAGGTGVSPVLGHGQDAHATAGGDRSSPLHRALPWGLCGLLAIVAAVFAIGYFERAPQTSMRFSAVTNFAGVQAQPALSPDGRSVAFVSNRDGHYNIYVTLVSGGSLVQITDSPNLKESPHWSPDGTKLVFSQLNDSGIPDIWEIPALGGTPRRLIFGAKDPDWSPDGRSLAYLNMADDTIWISDASGQNRRRVMPPPASPLANTQPRYSPDGSELAFVVRPGGPYGELAIADVASGKVRQLTHDDALALSPAWSPDGRSIYFASSRGGTMNIWKIAAAGGEPQQITSGQGDDAELDVSADGKRIVFSTFRENMHIVQLDLEAKAGERTLKVLTSDPARNQIAPVYSPDGKRLAYFSNRKGAEKESIWVSNADGSNPVELVQDSRVNIFPQWTPDGEHLVYNSEVSGLHEGAEYRLISISGGAPLTLKGSAPDFLFDVGPQGRLLYKNSEGRVESYSLSNHQAQTLAPHLPGGNWGQLRWSPDGKSVAYEVEPSVADDSRAGLWVDDLKNPPRQIFRGWVLSDARGPGGTIYVLEGKADMTGVFWKVGWNGQILTRLPSTVPLISSYWTQMPRAPQEYFDVSPDGRHVAIDAQGVLQANIGLIENVR
jgi:eukaryotic-like serine/threonine-protein kinase